MIRGSYILVVGIVGLSILTAGPAQAQEIQWVKQFGTAQLDVPADIDVIGSRVTAVGHTMGAVPGSTNQGSFDGFIYSMDLDGNIVWAKQFGTSVLDAVYALDSVEEGGANVHYVAGQTDGVLPGQTKTGGQVNAFVIKYDANGNVVWIRQFGSTDIAAATAIAASSSGVYVTGWTTGAMSGQTQLGDLDVFIRKFDANGNVVWTKQLGSSALDYASGIAVAATHLHVAGYTAGTLSGQTNLGKEDAFVLKLDLNGNILWTKQFGSSGSDIARKIRIGSAPIVVGETGGQLPGQTSMGGLDAFITRLDDSSGNTLWTKQFGTTKDDSALGLTVDSATGRIYFAGYTTGAISGKTNAGGQDLFAGSFNAEGSLIFTQQSGTSGDDAAVGVGIAGLALFLYGDTEGVFSGQTPAGGIDLFLSRLTSEVQPFDFNLRVNPDSGTVNLNGFRTVNTIIVAELVSGVAQPVTFSVTSSLPFGITVDLPIKSCTPNCEIGMGVTVSESFTPSVLGPQYPIEITASGGGVTKRVTFTLTVENFDFSLQVAPESETVNAGALARIPATVTVELRSLPGTGRLVTFSVSSPSGIAVQVSSRSCIPTCTLTLEISVSETVPVGEYSIEITGSGSGVTRFASLTVRVQRFDFTLEVSPSTVNMNPGSTAEVTATATLRSGKTVRVEFVHVFVPNGVSATFTVTGCSPTCTTVLRLSASESYTPGQYTVEIRGLSEKGDRTATFTLVLETLFDFSLEVTPSSGTASAGTGFVANIIARHIRGTLQTVSFSVAGVPAGVDAVDIRPCSPTCERRLTFVVRGDYTPGRYTVQVIGSGGGVTRTATFTLILEAPQPFDFSLIVDPDSATGAPGSEVMTLVSVNPRIGRPEQVSFSAPGRPIGVSVGFSPSSCIPGCITRMTIRIDQSLPAGEYPIDIIGSGAGLTRTVRFTLRVERFDFSLQVSSLPVIMFSEDNRAASVGISVRHLRGRTQVVSFSVLSVPRGVQASLSEMRCIPDCRFSVTLALVGDFEPGRHLVTITGTSGEVTRIAEFTLILETGVSFPITWEGETFRVHIRTDSTIRNFAFDQPRRQVSFDATGRSRAEVTLPRRMLDGPYVVQVDGQEVAAAVNSNSTHSTLSLSYPEGTHNIKITGTTVIPEFPGGAVGLLGAILASMILARLRLKRFFRSRHEGIGANMPITFTLPLTGFRT